MKKSTRKITLVSMSISIISSLISFILMSIFVTFINVTRDKYGLISDSDFKWRLQGIAGIFMLVSFIFAIIAILLIKRQKPPVHEKNENSIESVESKERMDV